MKKNKIPLWSFMIIPKPSQQTEVLFIRKRPIAVDRENVTVSFVWLWFFLLSLSHWKKK